MYSFVINNPNNLVIYVHSSVCKYANIHIFTLPFDWTRHDDIFNNQPSCSCRKV